MTIKLNADGEEYCDECERLAKEVERLRKALEGLVKEQVVMGGKQLRAENERLRHALEFYLDCDGPLRDVAADALREGEDD